MGVITWQNVCIFAYVLISCFIAIFAIDVVLPEFQLRLMCLQHVYILLQEKPMRPYFLILPTEITPISKLRKHKGKAVIFLCKKRYRRIIYKQLKKQNSYKNVDNDLSLKIMKKSRKLLKNHKTITEKAFNYVSVVD